MRCVAVVCAALALGTGTMAQAPPSPLLAGRDAVGLARRVVQLMESTSLAMPGMVRAGAPLVENARQSLANLEAISAEDSGLIYSLLANARAYLALSDALPKPYPFPEQAQKQYAELRESVDRLDSHFRALLELKETRARNPDRDNLKRYAEANERLGPPAPGAPRVVFLGDSITDGWRLNEYFTGRDFINRGIGGQITREMLGRMKADVIDLKPQAVLVLAGTNDIARGVPPSAIRNNLAMIAALAEFHKIQPLFASILPVSDYHKGVNPQFEMSKKRPPATIRELNGWLRRFCAEHGYAYVDYFSAMVDAAGFLEADLADDGLHPNSKGYRIMAPVALQALDRALAAQPGKKKRRKLF